MVFNFPVSQIEVIDFACCPQPYLKGNRIFYAAMPRVLIVSVIALRTEHTASIF